MSKFRVKFYSDFEFEIEAENECEARDKSYDKLKELYNLDEDDVSDVTVKKLGR